MKGVGRRGGIYSLCFDTSRDVWKAGRGYIAAAQTRDIAAVCTCAPPHNDGPSGHKAAREGRIPNQEG